MDKIIRQRINEHIVRGLPIARVTTGDGDYECNYCGTAFAEVDPEARPNFCPECGVLLDWTQEVDEDED